MGGKMDLPAFIETDIELIIEEWVEFAHALGVERTKLSLEQAQNASRALLLGIAGDMRTPQSADEQAAKGKGRQVQNSSLITSIAHHHAQERLTHGFSHEELSAEMRALRASVIRRWEQRPESNDVGSLIRFNEAIDQAWMESIAHYSAAVMRIRNLFVGVLAHDLRSPLGAVSMSAQYILKQQSITPGTHTASERIYRATSRMQRMVDDLLDFTRTRLGETLPIALTSNDLGAICHHAVEEVSASYPNVSIKETVEGDPMGVWDGGRLSQLVSNLLVNAAQHGDGNVALTAKCSGNSMKIDVTNNCKDIPPDVLQGMFDPLIRSETLSTKKGPAAGLGLGLYIVKEILKAHQGMIDVTSKDGTTTFNVLIPRVST
jgi:signal transduction histidine kinase